MTRAGLNGLIGSSRLLCRSFLL